MQPKYYLSPEVFRREQDKIFRKAWLFAGLTSMLPVNGDAMLRKVAGVPVRLGQSGGSLHASDGQRDLAVQAVGSLLFVNLDRAPLAITEQFSASLLESLGSCSAAWDSDVVLTTWHGRFNWKLVFENLRDPNHVRYLHGGGLADYIEQTVSVPEALLRDIAYPLSDLSPTGLHKELRRSSWGGASPALIPRRRKVPWHDKVQPWGGEDRYYDWLAYPNLHIASGNAGHSFTVESYTPVAPDRTDLELIWVMARRKQDFETAEQALIWNMHGSKQIVGEDIAMLEAIQAGLHIDAPVPVQGDYEAPNGAIERFYTTIMETEHGI
jgi:phenylpropionate dioxygenase-like ring-hydroxylating dioxygenase large terminal subunit